MMSLQQQHQQQQQQRKLSGLGGEAMGLGGNEAADAFLGGLALDSSGGNVSDGRPRSSCGLSRVPGIK